MSALKLGTYLSPWIGWPCTVAVAAPILSTTQPTSGGPLEEREGLGYGRLPQIIPRQGRDGRPRWLSGKTWIPQRGSPTEAKASTNTESEAIG